MQQKEQTEKWLLGLLYLGIATISLNVVTDILVNDSWASYLQLILSGGTVVCLYMLHLADKQYRLPALIRAVNLVLNLATLSISAFVMPELITTPEKLNSINLFMSLLGIVMSILSVLGLWFEYRAHGGLVSGADPAFQRKWTALFFWHLGTSLFYSIGTYVAAYLQQLLRWDITTTYALVLAILQLPGKVVYLLYLLYLYRTIRLVRE